MFEYKLRAECVLDLVRLLSQLVKVHGGVYDFEVQHIDGFPDVIMTFYSRLSLQKIKSILSTIEDSHVMLETIAHVGEYTGERRR